MGWYDSSRIVVGKQYLANSQYDRLDMVLINYATGREDSVLQKQSNFMAEQHSREYDLSGTTTFYQNEIDGVSKSEYHPESKLFVQWSNPFINDSIFVYDENYGLIAKMKPVPVVSLQIWKDKIIAIDSLGWLSYSLKDREFSRIKFVKDVADYNFSNKYGMMINYPFIVIYLDSIIDRYHSRNKGVFILKANSDSLYPIYSDYDSLANEWHPTNDGFYLYGYKNNVRVNCYYSFPLRTLTEISSGVLTNRIADEFEYRHLTAPSGLNKYPTYYSFCPDSNKILISFCDTVAVYKIIYKKYPELNNVTELLSMFPRR
jgi:hypothetical protein